LECFDQANALVQMIHAFYTCEEKWNKCWVIIMELWRT
jgi:hypothetical protein